MRLRIIVTNLILISGLAYFATAADDTADKESQAHQRLRNRLLARSRRRFARRLPILKPRLPAATRRVWRDIGPWMETISTSTASVSLVARPSKPSTRPSSTAPRHSHARHGGLGAYDRARHSHRRWPRGVRDRFPQAHPPSVATRPYT